MARVLIVPCGAAGARWRASCGRRATPCGDDARRPRGRDRRDRRRALRRRPGPDRDADGRAARRHDRLLADGDDPGPTCTPGGCGCCGRSSSTPRARRRLRRQPRRGDRPRRVGDAGRSRSRSATRWATTVRSGAVDRLLPEQQVAEDPGGRAPDHVAVDLVDVGLEVIPRRTRRLRSGRRPGRRARTRAPRRPRSPGRSTRTRARSAHEGIDRVVGDERADGGERADDVDVRRGGRPTSSCASRRAVSTSRLAGVAAPAGERDLAGVAAEVVAAPGEDGVQAAAPSVNSGTSTAESVRRRGPPSPAPPRA